MGDLERGAGRRLDGVEARSALTPAVWLLLWYFVVAAPSDGDVAGPFRTWEACDEARMSRPEPDTTPCFFVLILPDDPATDPTRK